MQTMPMIPLSGLMNRQPNLYPDEPPATQPQPDEPATQPQMMNLQPKPSLMSLQPNPIL